MLMPVAGTGDVTIWGAQVMTLRHEIVAGFAVAGVVLNGGSPQRLYPLDQRHRPATAPVRALHDTDDHASVIDLVLRIVTATIAVGMAASVLVGSHSMRRTLGHLGILLTSGIDRLDATGQAIEAITVALVAAGAVLWYRDARVTEVSTPSAGADRSVVAPVGGSPIGRILGGATVSPSADHPTGIQGPRVDQRRPADSRPATLRWTRPRLIRRTPRGARPGSTR
jgi:hypothetical protein